jgi:ribonuclease HII
MKKIKIWIDEAWRWPWLWPVVASALCFDLENIPDKSILKEINDSKKLSEKKREKIFNKLIEFSSLYKPWVFFWVWVVDNYTVDEINIREANKEAMRRAIIELLRKIDPGNIDSVVIDWKDNYEFKELKKKPIYIVGWDAKILEIWAASIIAKVFRDKLIKTYSSIYPNLDLEKYKWYGTKKHSDYLSWKDKITWIHRISYKPIKKILEEKPKLLFLFCRLF